MVRINGSSFPHQYRRTNSFPIDSTETWTSLANATTYARNTDEEPYMPYAGQTVSIEGDNNLYMLVEDESISKADGRKHFKLHKLSTEELSDGKYVSRLHDDTVAGHLTLEKGATSESLIQANGGLVVRSSALKNEFSNGLSEIGDGDSETLSILLSENGDDAPESMSTPLMEVPRSGGFNSGSLGEMDNTDESFDIVPDGNYMMQKRAGVFYPVKASASGGGTKLSLSFVTPSNITVVHGSDALIKYSFSSTLSGEETGEGIVSYTVNGKQAASETIVQGEVSFNAGKYLSLGDNQQFSVY